MNLKLSILALYQCVITVLGGSVTRGDYAEVRLFGEPAAYDVETSVALNDVSKKNKEVGYKVTGSLLVRPVWARAGAETLLKFNLLNPKLHLRGKHLNADFRPFASIWDSYGDTEFYVHWKSGTIETAYLDSSEPVDILNYKKSLISLFQFQIIDGEYKENDISGTCDVLYDSISTDVFRKIKRACVIPGTQTAEAEVATARRVTRYTLGAGALQDVYADELLQLELRGAGVGVKARSWHRLRLAPARPAPAAPLAPLAPLAADDAPPLHALPAHLAPQPLVLGGDDNVDEYTSPEEASRALAEALADGSDALQAEAPGAGGGAAAARAVLRLLPALRAADAPALRALLQRAAAPDAHPDRLIGLCRMLGLAGTAAAHAAADALLQLGARDALQPHADAYLAAFALAAAPARAAAADVARLAETARAPRVAAAALLAAAAAAARLPDPAHERALRDHIARDLARCKDGACRAVRLQALGQLRRADAAALLLEHAEGADGAAALAALDALGALPAAALTVARRRRLERLALRDGPALEVRAAALDLWLRSSAARPLPLAETAAALHRGPLELRRLFWQRLHALAEADAQARDVLAMLPTELRAWPAQAHAGTSLALTRDTGWSAGGWAARLDSLQVAAAGLLRRGRVRLLADAPDNSTHDQLTVEVWTRGLEALAGGGVPDAALRERDAGTDAPDAAGGLALAVGGVPMPPIDLFTGQAELLGHVWAGTGSTPTAVLRALRPLPTRAAALPLLGGLRAHASASAAIALALDAHAQVSLWSRSARASLQLRAGGAGEARLRARTAWGRLEARAAAEAEPRLRIAADLDFYDVVALCVRVRLDDYENRRFSWLESEQGERPLRVRRSLNASQPLAGRTLSLGRAGDRACRALTAPDDE